MQSNDAEFAGSFLSGSGGDPAGRIRYEIVARRTDDTHPGAVMLIHHAYAQSVEEAVAMVRAAHERPGGVYGDQGLYRVVKVMECEDQ